MTASGMLGRSTRIRRWEEGEMIQGGAYCSVAVSCPGGTVREETTISTEKCQARGGTLGVVYKHVDKCRNIIV
jgi:hypothetical protein